jgi:hypothetical protein
MEDLSVKGNIGFHLGGHPIKQRNTWHKLPSLFELFASVVEFVR